MIHEHTCRAGVSLAPDVATCGTCERSWCFRCHPTPASLCPWENGDTPPAEHIIDDGLLTFEQSRAARALLETIDGYTLCDIATQLTCTEANVIAEFRASFGVDSEDFLIDHARGDDDESDMHVLCPECDTLADDDGYCVDAGCPNVGKVVQHDE